MGTPGFAVIRLPGGSGSCVLLLAEPGGTGRDRSRLVSPAPRRVIMAEQGGACASMRQCAYKRGYLSAALFRHDIPLSIKYQLISPAK